MQMIYLKMILRARYFLKKAFWIGTLVTQHKVLNGSHDLNRHQRIHRYVIHVNVKLYIAINQLN